MIERIKHWVRNFFGFSKTETNGFLVLLFIMGLLLLMPFFSSLFSSTYTAAIEDKILLDSLSELLNKNGKGFEHFDEKKRTKEHVAMLEPELFPFDPNKADLSTFLRLGIKQDVGQRIINYREAGGSFHIKNDLRKIFGLSKETYDRLHTNIQLPEKLLKVEQENKVVSRDYNDKALVKKEEEMAVLAFDINVADTIQLKKIYGIGPVLAARIVKYRTLIGGFVNAEQLKEVYGLEEEVINKLNNVSFIEEDFVPVKVNLNEANVEEMASHPYVSYPLAKALYAYRRQHGKYKVMDQLLQIHLMDSAIYNKLKPYVAL